METFQVAGKPRHFESIPQPRDEDFRRVEMISGRQIGATETLTATVATSLGPQPMALIAGD